MQNHENSSLEKFKPYQLSKQQQAQVKGGNGEETPPVIITEEVIID